MNPYMTRKEGGSDIVRNKDRTGRSYFAGITAAAALMMAPLTGNMEGMPAVKAADNSGMPRSKGVIRCEQAVLDAADLQDLYGYVTQRKRMTADVLLQLGTKFRQQPGGIICDRNPESGPGDADLSQLSWPVLIQAVTDSQKVPDGLTVLNPEKALHIEGVEECTDYYVPAAADNISRGKAAWTDGRLVLGNGADNDRAYQKGIGDGENGHVPDFLHPLFLAQEAVVEIRHVHVGNPEEVAGISGCYENSKESKKQSVICGGGLRWMPPIWMENPEEPEGGSWHGGYYTCPHHDGIYESAGTCPHEDVVVTVVWQHDLICGLEDAVYARLSVRGNDTDHTDGAIRLEAVLEEGDAFGKLLWQEEERLVWSDEAGNVLGTGMDLSVQSPGTYRCSIRVQNEDVDNRELAIGVKVAGLVLKN